MPASPRTLENLVKRHHHLCQKAYEKAVQGNWQSFAQLGVRQWRLMMFLQPIFTENPPDQPLLAWLLEAKEYLDQAIALAEQRTHDLLAKMNTLKAGKKGIAHYHDAERIFLDS